MENELIRYLYGLYNYRNHYSRTYNHLVRGRSFGICDLCILWYITDHPDIDLCSYFISSSVYYKACGFKTFQIIRYGKNKC